MKNTTIIIFLGFFLRILYAGWVGYLGDDEGLDRDAEVFYQKLIQISRSGIFESFEIGPAIMLNTIGSLMSVFGESLYFVCILSCIAWLVSALLFTKCLDFTDSPSKCKVIIAALFAFWPTAIPYTAIPLREPYQLMFISLALFGGIKVIRTRSQIYWLLTLTGLVGAGLLHGGLAAFSVAMLILSIIFYSIIGNDKFPVGRIIFALVVSIPIGLFSLEQFSSVSYNISSGLVESVQLYEVGGADVFGRSTYKDSLDYSTGLSAYVDLFIGVLQYLFEPLPFRIGAAVDVVLFFENCIRLSIIVGTLIEIRKSQKHSQRTFLVYLFFVYVTQEIIWSLGTANWGTASRHHVPAMGLLLITGTQAWLLRNNRLNYAVKRPKYMFS